MLKSLSSIYDFLKSHIDALSAISGFDFYIVDHNMIRIACTGKFDMVRGAPLSKNSISYHVFSSGKQLYMDNPGENALCDLCEVMEMGKCLMEHAMYYPLQFEGGIIGVIVVNAVSDDQKEKMQNMQKELNQMLVNMSEIIRVKLLEKRDVSRYLSIINRIEEGIIITDYKGDLLHSNSRSGIATMQYKNIRELIEEKYLAAVERAEYGESVKVKMLHLDGEVGLSKIFVNIEERFSDVIYMMYFSEKDCKKTGGAISSGMHEVVGTSSDMVLLRSQIEKASKFDLNVLILGESGTGKGMIARKIHDESARKKNPFVALNCSAIPENLLESELFGYEGGAFSGADSKGKAGCFELANNGTIFLDEIGDMNLSLQPKLLKVLDNQLIRRVGGTEDIKLNVRIIAATNRNLEEMIEEGAFRDDLYYRLSVMNIETSPLRNRPEDIVALANFYIDKYSRQYGKRIQKMSEKAMRNLLMYEWPGNIRELDNVIEYAVAMESKNIIQLKSLPQKFESAKATAAGQSIATMKKAALKDLLKKYEDIPFGKQKIAEELGISISTLYRYIKKYGLT